MRLRCPENRSLAEIAERLGTTKVTAAGLIKRGMLALREQLGPQQ